MKIGDEVNLIMGWIFRNLSVGVRLAWLVSYTPLLKFSSGSWRPQVSLAYWIFNNAWW